MDVDHLVAVRSLSLDRAPHLQLRPATHSLTFALAAGAIAYLVSRRPGVAWALLAPIASHVLRDASSGTAPLPSMSVPRWAYYAGELGLLTLSHLLPTSATAP